MAKPPQPAKVTSVVFWRRACPSGLGSKVSRSNDQPFGHPAQAPSCPLHWARIWAATWFGL